MGLIPAGTASTSSSEGTVEFAVTFEGRQERHQTWYKVVSPANRHERDAGQGGDASQLPLSGLKTAELTVFGDSSHMPHWEERDRYLTVVGSWLRGHDGNHGHDGKPRA